MITVNLRPDLKRKRAGSPLTGLLDERASELGSKIKDPAPARRRGEPGWACSAGWASSSSAPRRAQRAGAAAGAGRAENKRFKAFLGREAAAGDDPRLAGRPDQRHPQRRWRPLRLAPPARRGHQGACRPTPGWWIWAPPLPAAPLRRRRAGRRPARPSPARSDSGRRPPPAACSSRSTAAPWTSRPTPGSSASSRPRPGSPTSRRSRRRRWSRRSGR